jgi:hypothetical protein
VGLRDARCGDTLRGCLRTKANTQKAAAHGERRSSRHYLIGSPLISRQLESAVCLALRAVLRLFAQTLDVWAINEILLQCGKS